MDGEDEHNLSDDAFDLLPDTTLRELEQNAILSTQQANVQTANQPQQNHSRLGSTRTVSAATKAVADAQSRLRPPLTTALPQLAEADGAYDDESFEFLDDHDVATPVEEVEALITRPQVAGEMTQREQWRQERFGRPAAQFRPTAGEHPRAQKSNYLRPAQQRAIDSGYHDHTMQDSMPLYDVETITDIQGATSGDDALLARIDDLLKERDQLTTELCSTKGKLMTQQGEIAIIRENKNKETKVFDRQLSALKKSMQEESARQKAALQALTEKSEKIATANRFLKHELAEEAEKAKALQTRLKEKPAVEKSNELETTPRKGPANSLRDGFDDDEMMVYSPSKSARRSKPTTPTAAGKRKRKADMQSPVRPLVLRQSGNAPPPPEEAQARQPELPRAERVVPIIRRDLRAERNLLFVQTVLNYRLKSTGDRLIENLIKFHFPSDPSRAFSSIILDATAQLKGPRLPADFLQAFVELWARSLKEKYYDCVGLLIEVVDYIIDVDMAVVDKGTITMLLPVLQDSTHINGFTRFKHSPVNQSTFGQFRQTPQSALNHKVDGNACMDLLHKIACVVEDEFPLINLFWRSMSTDFVLMMLNSWQPIADTTLMFHLLSTSIFPNTFGCVCPDEQQQSKMEAYIIERVSYLLWETPKTDEGLAPLSRADICKFRIEAMKLLTALAIDSSLPPHDDREHHGSRLVAHHPSAIARIVRSLYDEVAAMYQLTPSHALHAELVNRGVRLLFHLMRLHGEDIDMQTKLSAVNGGVNKHRVVLTRLAFSEGVYVDRLITDETVAMATTMLEDSVTPDEADQLIEAFPNFRGRRAMQD